MTTLQKHERGEEESGSGCVFFAMMLSHHGTIDAVATP
jgi:hypothetical protein